MELSEVRIDKWLWAVRLYKTRTMAADACRAGHIEIGGHAVKPSRSVRVGEIISARVGIITKTVKVLGLIDRRVGAPVAKLHLEDLTPPSEYAKLTEVRHQPVFHPPGLGRPTKKNRRAIERLLSDGV
ncbi:MAG: RNA-binding S4 domain-containing protein [Verrucomicrobia bacterium]|nr:RNA-binding S4 domain-containing protein [Verrucomicrobiota bacterium]